MSVRSWVFHTLVLKGAVQFDQSGTRVWEKVFGSILSGGVGRSATSLASVRCSGGIHRGPGQRCQISGEQCAG
ncbi:hypothetical protein EVAR_17215_1 [Eumeta japonica]|uniref:Uncharacterized protein n=1 Tax=Eumeta variegata TaxID=151549 RepID=A0A4C1U931_EUMVA|nr:hypothetical protein EVAR_17215_1 [Eumeta japonica]